MSRCSEASQDEYLGSRLSMLMYSLPWLPLDIPEPLKGGRSSLSVGRRVFAAISFFLGVVFLVLAGCFLATFLLTFFFGLGLGAFFFTSAFFGSGLMASFLTTFCSGGFFASFAGAKFFATGGGGAFGVGLTGSTFGSGFGCGLGGGGGGGADFWATATGFSDA